MNETTHQSINKQNETLYVNKILQNGFFPWKFGLNSMQQEELTSS